ncbi:MAG TPA: hypothetical protein DIU00_21405 [Phycisphaerales bacterium]|nr:hypothetical protein [Phycisphaerales bacterium]
MVENAKCVRIIIASPSDIKAERDSIPRIFSRWNSAHKDVHLESLMAETGTVPEMGDHPQHILNRQLVEKGDLLIAIFWSKIGTPTPTAKSGTIEEIREFIKIKGPSRVMVYFCIRPIQSSPSELAPEEIQTLIDFKKEMQTQCFYKEFANTDRFEALLYPDLDIIVPKLLNGELQAPDSKKTVLSQDTWYKKDHPDSRLQKPIHFGNSFSEIAKNFSIRMDDFDKINGATDNKFLDLGYHVYMSVARAIENQIVSREHEIPYSTRLMYQDIAIRLNNLAKSKSVDRFSEFFEEGKRLSDELEKLEKGH